MTRASLRGPLLKSVSRSFYLTIRVLPARLQEPIGLAYLLARASDTIADTAIAPAAIRLRHLAAFGRMIQSGDVSPLPALQDEIRPPDAAERTLISSLELCLRTLNALEEFDRLEIVRVMEKIIRGQTLDLQRFDGAETAALESAADLEEYTYLVAGCVGEFWTQVCLHHLPRYSNLDREELLRLAIDYGKGLQLVNILRDLPADLRAGRCYLPADELPIEPAALLAQPERVGPVFDHWVRRASAYLDRGADYIAAIRPARVRIGCFLPWYLGNATLQLMRERPPLENLDSKIKVSRSTVRRALVLSIPAAVSNRMLREARTRASRST